MRLADVDFTERDGAVVAAIRGDIDMSNASALGDAVGHATPSHALRVILDLTSVDYLDSAGIHLIFELRQSLRDRDLELTVVIPSHSPANDALRLAGLMGRMDVVETVEEALAA
jgi:anti-sigma B factor antagonist